MPQWSTQTKTTYTQTYHQSRWAHIFQRAQSNSERTECSSAKRRTVWALSITTTEISHVRFRLTDILKYSFSSSSWSKVNFSDSECDRKVHKSYWGWGNLCSKGWETKWNCSEVRYFSCTDPLTFITTLQDSCNNNSGKASYGQTSTLHCDLYRTR